jgi:hypothetical protein
MTHPHVNVIERINYISCKLFIENLDQRDASLIIEAHRAVFQLSLFFFVFKSDFSDLTKKIRRLFVK